MKIFLSPNTFTMRTTRFLDNVPHVDEAYSALNYYTTTLYCNALGYRIKNTLCKSYRCTKQCKNKPNGSTFCSCFPRQGTVRS